MASQCLRHCRVAMLTAGVVRQGSGSKSTTNPGTRYMRVATDPPLPGQCHFGHRAIHGRVQEQGDKGRSLLDAVAHSQNYGSNLSKSMDSLSNTKENSQMQSNEGRIKVYGTSTGPLPCHARRMSTAHSIETIDECTTQRIEIVDTVHSIRDARHAAWLQGRRVALVPTMGALHDGHLDLVRAAARECDEVFVSIYVNPAQFGVNDDLSSYPRTFDKDLAELQKLNTDIENCTEGLFRGRVTHVFRPSTEAMYPVGLELGSYIAMNPTLSQVLEGRSRPQFFQGVSTVVTKLLNIVQPDRVYFGQKDIQQLIVVQRMINEFHLPSRLRCIVTRRHTDGLAMSSRNVYIGARRRAVAVSLYSVLHGGLQRYLANQTSREEILGDAIKEAEYLRQSQLSLPPSQRAKFDIDYLSLADPTYLTELDRVENHPGAVLSGAMVMLPLEDPRPDEQLGVGEDKRPVRLIDNFLLGTACNIGSS